MAAQDNAKHGKIEKQQQLVIVSSFNLTLHNHGVKRNGGQVGKEWARSPEMSAVGHTLGVHR